MLFRSMHFKVTVTLRASRVEKWIRAVKSRFLDAAPIKCVGLDCEFTDPRNGGRANQRAAVLQLSVASEILVFQICWADKVPQLLKDFLRDKTIRFCGAAINNDVCMLSHYGIDIPSAFDLQTVVRPNPTTNPTPSLYALSNAIIGTNLEKKKRKKVKDNKKEEKKSDEEKEKEEELIFGWANYPLSYEQVHYAALDARLGFEIARRHWHLHGYNSHVDHLNI